MGRRSRKRAAADASSRAERDAARRERARAAAQGQPVRKPRPGRPGAEERPAAPWGSFPLSELVVLLGIALMIWGLVTWKGGGGIRFGAGLAIASLAGLELSLREHLAGFRSHTTLLSGVAAFAAVTALALGPGPNRVWVLAVVAAVVFGASFYLLRELFKKRSGGLGFR